MAKCHIHTEPGQHCLCKCQPNIFEPNTCQKIRLYNILQRNSKHTRKTLARSLWLLGSKPLLSMYWLAVSIYFLILCCCAADTAKGFVFGLTSLVVFTYCLQYNVRCVAMCVAMPCSGSSPLLWIYGPSGAPLPTTRLQISSIIHGYLFY